MKRDFKGVWIPKQIWLNNNLTVMEKLFLVEIDSLDNSDGCFASNRHFSGFFQLTKNRCTEIIKSLEKKGFVTVELEKKGKAITRRIIKVIGIRKNEHPYSEKRDSPIRKNEHPYSENRDDNNTSNINTIEGRQEAISILKEHYPVQWETFMIQYKSKIQNWVKFIANFNDTIVLEDLVAHDKIWARLRKYASTWAENDSKKIAAVSNGSALDKIKMH